MSKVLDNLIIGNIPDEVRSVMKKEMDRLDQNVELIASENFPSDAVRLAAASIFTCKYAEGYAAERADGVGRTGRYYGGCENVNEMEEACCEAWRKVFNTNYHVNVQPHSGSHANMAAYASVLNPGDTILSMSMNAGGHLTHSSPVSFVSKTYNVETYDITSYGYINMEELRDKIFMTVPKAIVVGASSYSREIDYKAIRYIIDDVQNIYAKKGEDYKPTYIVDMAHPAGLIAAGLLKSPFPWADIVTTTTHKTLRGIRGGLIFCKPELAKAVDSAVFPCTSGGPHEHIIFAKWITAIEAATNDFKKYAANVKANADFMAKAFIDFGYTVVSGGTDNHMFCIDVTSKFPTMTGKEAQDVLDKHNITTNKNMIPNDRRKPNECSGIRIGTAAMTTAGWNAGDFISCAGTIDDILTEYYEKTRWRSNNE